MTAMFATDADQEGSGGIRPEDGRPTSPVQPAGRTANPFAAQASTIR